MKVRVGEKGRRKHTLRDIVVSEDRRSAYNEMVGTSAAILIYPWPPHKRLPSLLDNHLLRDASERTARSLELFSFAATK